MGTVATLAQYHMDHGDHMDSGWHWGVMALMLLVLLAVVAAAVWLVRSSSSHAHAAQSAGAVPVQTPKEILDRRLAHGEISPEEYRERVALLGGE